MFNMYSHRIQQNLMQMVLLHEIIVKNKVMANYCMSMENEKLRPPPKKKRGKE